MLTSLQIENIAVIEKAEISFNKGLNVLTGETGAGKSIIIDSINAVSYTHLLGLGCFPPPRHGIDCDSTGDALDL